MLVAITKSIFERGINLCGRQMELEEYLDPDEFILWRGQPTVGLLLRKSDLLLLPFGLVWAIGAIPIGIFMVMASIGSKGNLGNTTDASIFITVFGSALGSFFILAGLYFLPGRFLFDSLSRAGTIYALTNRRALILRGLFRNSLKSMPITPQLEIGVSGRRRGAIEFGPDHNKRDKSESWKGSSHPFVFEGIGDVKQVYDIVRTIQRDGPNLRPPDDMPRYLRQP